MKNHTKRLSYAPAAFTSLLLALACGSSAAAAADAVVLRDGLVIDGSQVYAMAPGGGIDALALRDGASLWHSDDADRPVTGDGDALLAQRDDSARPGRLTLLSLNVGDGSVAATGTLALPADVRAGVDDRLNSRFALRAVPGAADELVWRYDYRLAQGAPTDDAVAQPRRSEGVIAVRTSGSALNLSASSRAAPAAVTINRVATVPFAGADGRAFYSEDRQHVLVSRRIGSRDYAWAVHSTDGTQLGKMRAAQSFTPFVVRHGMLLYVSPPAERRQGQQMRTIPLTLRAVDLSSGEEVWSRPLRDTRYAGPYPP